MELIDLVNCYNFSISNDLTQIVTWILDLHQTQNRMPHFIVSLMNIIVLIGVVFVIIWEMFHGRISLYSMLLLLLLNFVSGFRLELICKCLMISGKASLISLFLTCLCCCYNSQKLLFHLYWKNKSSESKVKIRQASNHCKMVLEAAKLAYANKTKESITFQKLGSSDLWWMDNIVLNNEGKSDKPPIFKNLEVLSFASDKAKLFAKNFSKNSNLNDSGIFLLKMVQKVIANLVGRSHWRYINFKWWRKVYS